MDSGKTKKKDFGELGVGDPNDMTLRHVERDLIVPQLKAELIRNEKCSVDIQTYYDCVSNAGLILAPIKCKNLKLAMADCITYWHESEELFARAKKEYLEDRSEFRRTGICKKNREYLQKLFEEKEKQTQN